jgi:hypothetical protein
VSPEPIPVRTLLGARSFADSVVCLRSLLACTADPIRLIVHEDGTLTDGHRDELRRLAADVELVPRAAADAAVLPLLAGHPRCLKARASGALFLKLFDIPLLAGKQLAYCDSDVLFVRRFRGLFDPPPRPARLAFMTDVAHAFAVRPWRVWPAGRIRLGGGVNTGLIVGDPAALDLDHVEWLLGALAGDTGFARRPYWAEQTCWSAVAARAGFALYDGRRLVLAGPRLGGVTDQTVGIHFVSTYRNRLDEFRDLRPPAGDPVGVATRPGRAVSAAGLFWADLRRRLVRRTPGGHP